VLFEVRNIPWRTSGVSLFDLVAAQPREEDGETYLAFAGIRRPSGYRTLVVSPSAVPPAADLAGLLQRLEAGVGPGWWTDRPRWEA
jgi:hypothetical protein